MFKTLDTLLTIFCFSIAAATVGRKVASFLRHFHENLMKDFSVKRMLLNWTVILAYSRLYDI